MIRFHCPSCNASLKINDSLAGRKCACPKCGQRLDVPAPAAPPATPTVEDASDKATKPILPRRYLLVASVLVAVLLALGSFWFFFLRESPSRVLVSAIMIANAGHYSAADACVLPESMNASYSKVGSQWIWDGITKQGTVKNITVLNEQIRGEGATVRVSIAYQDGASSQVEETFRKVDGKWKLSLMGLMQSSLSGVLSARPNSSGFVPSDPQNPLGLGRPRQLPLASNQKPVIRTPAYAKKPAAPQSEPALQRNGDDYKLAMEKLGEFQRAGDDASRSRIAVVLAEMSRKWTVDESSNVVEAVAKLGTSGKPLARLLCQIISNQPYPLGKSPVVRNALEALETVHPQLYQPVVVMTIGESDGYSFEKDIKELVKLGDSAPGAPA